MINFSLVIPCYNEAENLPYLLEKISSLLNRSGIEVILVDNGSCDATPNILKKLLPLYPSVRTMRVEVNQGYGHGILKGLEIANGNILGWTHADMQTDPLDAYEALKKINLHPNDAVVAKGTRIGRPPADYFFTLGMQIFASITLCVSLEDINAQPKLFSRDFYEKYIRNHAPLDFSIDLFLLYSAKIHGIKTVNVPVVLSKRLHGKAKGGGADNKTRMKIIFRTIKYILQLRKNRLKVRNVNH